MGTPLLSTPHPISEKDAVYEAIKTHLKITTLKEMETVPWQGLLAAYQVCDPKHALGEQVMIDGQFIDENWADRFSFAGDGNGEVMVGNTGAEGTTVTIVLQTLPTADPKPTTPAIIVALSSIAAPSKIDPILSAYSISPSSTESQIAAALLAMTEDIMWYHAAFSLSSQLRARKVPVYEYSFEQLQPFTGPFKGVAGHSLDLAYLHGDPGIFSYCPDPKRELAIQDSMQNAWIGFANGEKPWDGSKTRVFGPEGKTVDLANEEVLRGLRRGKAWESLDVLTWEELTAFSGVAVGFYGQLVGSG
jgi:carboxylesterase type B